jgi:flagellar biogenesis protein FliO
MILIGFIWLILGGHQVSSPQTLSPSGTPGAGTSQIHYTSYLLRMAFITVVLVGAIVIMAYWYKRTFLPKGTQGLAMEILGKAYLGTRQHLVLVKILNAYLLMGITDQAINVIREYKVSDIPDGLLNRGAEISDLPFSDWLKKFLNRNQQS